MKMQEHTENVITFIYMWSVFPKASKKPLHFTIARYGIIIKENVCNHLAKNLSGSETIQWLWYEEIVLKKEVGGLGLGIIFEFIKLKQ